MPTYVIVDTKIENPEAYEEYKALARPIAEKFGGVYRARGGEMDIKEDQLWQPTRLVIIEFPDREAFNAFYNSDEYAPVRAKRWANSQCTLVAVDGV